MAVIGGHPSVVASGLQQNTTSSSATMAATATAAADANKPGGDRAAFETATDVQLARTPNGTLAHRNYLCPSLRGEKGEARSEADARNGLE